MFGDFSVLPSPDEIPHPAVCVYHHPEDWEDPQVPECDHPFDPNDPESWRAT
jgi:hypothetical protein